MSVECPRCEWPAVLEERGPLEDPSILLTGTARVGDTAVQIVAIRINPALRFAPDYKQGLSSVVYGANGLDEILETVLEEFEYVSSELDQLVGESRSCIVELATGRYVLCIVPDARVLQQPGDKQ
jgi:hypothetical protein